MLHEFSRLYSIYRGLPRWLSDKESTCNAGDVGLIPGLKAPLKEEMATTPVFLPGKSHGQRSLVGCSPWAGKGVKRDLAIKQQLHL